MIFRFLMLSVSINMIENMVFLNHIDTRKDNLFL